ncbi:hypothetical protein OIU78_015626, partial [Salix suchowensis]
MRNGITDCVMAEL